MTRTAAPKLVAYPGISALLLSLAVAFGQVGFVVAAAPFLVALLVGLAMTRRQPPAIEVVGELSSETVVEGTEIVYSLQLVCPESVDRLEVGIALPEGLVIAEGHPLQAVRLAPGVPEVLEIKLQTPRWGSYKIGPLAARMRDPGGLYLWQGPLGEVATLQARPSREVLRSLIRPDKVGAAGGDQTSRLRGEGIEFADIRPYSAGDRGDRINWRATARRGTVYVNDRHPERSTDVVLFIDTFATVGLEDTVRIASVLATSYLRSRDRVGLVGFGGVLSWIEPGGGQKQLERIIDALTATDAYLSYAWKRIDDIPARTFPARCLVICISPLLDERVVAAVANLRARGLDIAVVEVAVPLPADATSTPLGQLALRLYAMQRQILRDRLGARGVVVATASGEGGAQTAVTELGMLRRRAHIRSGM